MELSYQFMFLLKRIIFGLPQGSMLGNLIRGVLPGAGISHSGDPDQMDR